VALLASLVVVVAGILVGGAVRGAPPARCPAPHATCWFASRWIVDAGAEGGWRRTAAVVLVPVPPPPGALERLQAVAPADAAADGPPYSALAATRWTPAAAPPAGYPPDLPFLAGQVAQTVVGAGTRGEERRARWTFAAAAARDSAFDQLAAGTAAAGWRGGGLRAGGLADVRRADFERAGRRRTIFAAYARRRVGAPGRDSLFTWWGVEVIDTPPVRETPAPDGTDLGAFWAWPTFWDPAPGGAAGSAPARPAGPSR
jgi:hypothetical protein